MKVQEVMERTGIKQTGRAIAYIKDALEEINLISETHVTTERIDLTENQRAIPRLVYEPLIKDADGS